MLTHNKVSLYRRLLALAAVCILTGAPFAAPCQNAARIETKVVSIDSLGKTSVLLQPGKSYMIEVAQDESRLQETFPDDWFELRVKDQNQKLVASKPFQSSYHKFHIDIVDLDGDGRKEFVFSLGEGRGTSARRETLYIEHFEDFHFKQVLATPLSDFYASGRKWWYSVEFKNTGGGTTDVVLRLHTDADSANKSAQVGIPAEQTKVFRWRTITQPGAKSSSKQLDAEFVSP
jgi:hypothetical protein